MSGEHHLGGGGSCKKPTHEDAMKNVSRAQQCWIKMETFSIKKKKYRHDGRSTSKKSSIGVNQKPSLK